MNERKMYASTHTHWEDQFDSDYDRDKACRRFKELGAVGFCLTQHGVLSGVEPMREKAAEYGLKFVPGIETYYGNEDDLRQNQHLILLAKNYDGYRAIWKAVSDRRSQNTQGRSVMNLDIIKEYFGEGSEGYGNVIATSACINGVIATTLRANDIAHSEIEKLRRKAEKYTGGREKAEYFQKIVNDITSELLSKNEKKGALEKYANQKFAKREKAVEKLKNLGDPAYEEELAELNADKAIAASAADELKELKEDIATTKRRLSANNKSLKAAQEDAERESFYDKQIKKIEATMKSDQQLFEAACNAATLFLSVFGNRNFYMEVQNHGIDTEREIYPVLVKVARKVGIPLIAANDIHTVDNSKEELLKRQIIRSLRFGTWEEESVGDDQLYIKTDEELAEWLSRILDADAVTEAMNNIKVVFDQCNVKFPEEKHYPVFPSVEGKTSKQILYDEICRGVKWRFGGFDKLPEGYRDRLKYEFNIITSMGYSDYHLIVKDFLEYGRALGPVPTEEIDNAPFDIKELNEWTKMHGWEGGFTIGPGRGSAVGSLVCYCLGITSLDPIKYNLLFERFLNPERVSMPDIDSDIAKRIRPKVIDYVRHKYGEDAVCGIMTTNAQAPRGTIRIAAKYYSQSIGRDGEFLALGDKMAKMVPNTPGISFDSNYENTSKTVYEHLKYEYANNQDAITILDWARIIEGCFTTYGAHAAGVVISDGAPVMNYIPLRWNEKLGEMTTQVDMNRVESKGLIKMDFLGLKTLDIITDCIRMVQKQNGITIDPLNIPMDDPRVFTEIFQKGRTNSVFQFESDGMKNMLKRFKPDSFEDLIILVSMFRPGPLQYLDGVIDVKNGVKPVSFLCPELKPILGKTYGAIVYQEQVMEIFQKLAGYTLGGADQVRRFMSKKKMDKLVHEREAFIRGDAERSIDGCVARGISEEVANKLFDEMTDFAKYAFNKSHAAAYAANSYYTAWLKLYYPAEFLAAALNWAETDKYAGLINEAKSFGVNVLIPDINRSYSDFTTTQDGNILFGLAGIKTVGSGAESIIEEREKNGPYLSLIDFFKRCDAKKDAVQNLMRAGAFDSFCKNRASMISVVETYKEAIKKCTAKEVALHNMEAMLPYVTELDTEEKLKNKMDELNIPAATISSVTTSVKLQARIDNAKKALTELSGAVENITLPEVEENYLERLNAERELLGVYVSQHPIGEYERDGSSVSIADGIAEGSEAKREIMGVITSIKRKTNRKGEPIAFLDVEDETGSVNVCVYAPSYRSCSSYLSEGNVLIFTGRFSEDQRSDDEKKYDFIVSEVRPARKMQRSILITCISEAGYKKSLHTLETRYKDPYGRKCSIYVNTTDKLYDVPFRVSAEVLKYPVANEI